MKPVPSQINPVYALKICFFVTHLELVLANKLIFPKILSSSDLPNKILIHYKFVFIICNIFAPIPSYWIVQH